MASAVAKENVVLITILSFSIKELTIKYPNILNKIKEVMKLEIFKIKVKKEIKKHILVKNMFFLIKYIF
jgi:hypothetical protein